MAAAATAAALGRLLLAGARRPGAQHARVELRRASYRTSEFAGDVTARPAYERVDAPAPEWRFVEALLRRRTVPPAPCAADGGPTEYPSGWRPQTARPGELPYFVARTKNHMPPVYLERRNRGARRLTVVRRVRGDAEALRREIEALLARKHGGARVATRLHESCQEIQVKGDYVVEIERYLLDKGM